MTESFAEIEARQIAASIEMARQNRVNYAGILRKHSDLGARFVLRTFATWRKSPATQSAFDRAKIVAAKPTSLSAWFVGPVGAGKTHLAAAIANAALDAGIPTMFATGIRLLEQVRASYDRDGSVRDGQRDVIGAFAAVDVLVLDDLGKERWTPWAGERIYDLVNRRYEGNRSIVVTSNLGADGLAELWHKSGMDEHYGRSIVRRIMEMCAGAVVEIAS